MDFFKDATLLSEEMTHLDETLILTEGKPLLPQKFIEFCNTNSAMKSYNEFNKKVLKWLLGRPQQIIVSNETHLAIMKKKLKSVTDEKEKEELRKRLEKDLNGYKRNKNYWINKSNVVPGVDKALKSKSIDRAIKITEELLDQLK